ncbi:WXG100 family type VII secretion target [Amycolatopsis anabasis]|uniref:WXG100 family type VII secretion target n=1 Tax=Amycolatopsis anabasis TaxID=1840409 RepID=UPI00131D837B|nr:PPE domain-containing protein [Amycolatopsis anabasis]
MTTNFAAYSHQQLYAMLQAGDSASARSAAGKWESTGIGLFEQAENLATELTDFHGSWTGGAADKYATMMTDLIGGIRKVAQTANAMRDLIEDAADALDKAKAQMPPPVDVPEVAPGDLALAANPPLLPPDASQETVLNAARARAAALANVEAQQQAANAASAAHSKAIVVMTNLAGEYTSAEESIPASPNAAEVPNAGGGTGGGGAPGSGLVGPAPGSPSVAPGEPRPAPGPGGGGVPGGAAPSAPKSSPLFGDMFTAGLAAASAAAFGRFGLVMPKVPSWAGGKKPADKDKGKEQGTAGSPAPATGDLGGLGGGAGVGGGIDTGAIGGAVGGAGVPGGAEPAAHSGLAGAPGGGNPLSGLAGGAAGAAGAAAAKSAMPMMPFMPMGMGGGDLGSGRRIPPWLVETEDVWGESSVVAPTVIGEEPETR